MEIRGATSRVTVIVDSTPAQHTTPPTGGRQQRVDVAGGFQSGPPVVDGTHLLSRRKYLGPLQPAGPAIARIAEHHRASSRRQRGRSRGCLDREPAAAPGGLVGPGRVQGLTASKPEGAELPAAHPGRKEQCQAAVAVSRWLFLSGGATVSSRPTGPPVQVAQSSDGLRQPGGCRLSG